MRHFRFIFSVIALLMFMSAGAQTVKVNVPSDVMVGENFRLVFTVSNTEVKEIRLGNLPEGVEKIYGPSYRLQTSYSNINGHATNTSSVSYTYILSANKKGSYTIPQATIWLSNGKTLHSQKRNIRAVENPYGNSNAGGAKKQQRQQNRSVGESFAGEAITGKDLFIQVSTNKKTVYEQEPVLLTYKVCTAVSLTQLDVKMPDVAGFLTEEVLPSGGRSFRIENIGGRTYKTAIWSQYLLYPQKSGDLTIPSLTFNGVVMQRDRNFDPFEAMFNGGSAYVEVNKKIKTSPVTLHVEPLPARPDNFSGAVGKFNIQAHLDKDEITANNAVTLRIEISGHGNMKLISCPMPELPKDFDKYDPKSTDKTELSKDGATGSMIYDIIIVPRNMGRYEIPPLEFTYFDLSEKKFKTIKTEKFTLNVLKGDGKSSYVDDFSNLKDRDIHGIKKGPAAHRSVDRLFFGSTGYWSLLIVTSVIFIALLIIFRRRAIENADIVKLKGKRANSVAVKRLRKADKLMKAGRDGEFFDEVLRALWGYVSDKLNMPSEQLLRENVEGKLSASGVGEETVQKFIHALDECEFERYAPGDKGVSMNKTFDSAMTAIMEIETDMRNNKKKKHKKNTESFVILILMMLLPCAVNASDKVDADAYYAKGNYQQAVIEYEKLLKEGESAEVYYNLGNAYYRLNNITRAVISYERALLLSPGDKEIKFNLEMARSKTTDKMPPRSEMFFVTFYKALVNMMSVDGWAVTAIVSIILSLILVLFYLFSSRITIRKVGFFGSAILLLLFVFSNLFAFQQKEQMTNRTGAVVVSSSTEVRKTPSDTSLELMIVHEGTYVEIEDGTMKEWFGVKLSDGTEGWVRKESVEVI